jgi:hypothetical protein
MLTRKALVTVVGDRGQESDHASILSVVGQILWEALAKSIATSSQLFEILKSFILDVLVLLGRICEFAPDANDWKIWGLVKPISTIWLFVIRPTPRLREPSQSYDKMSYIIRLWGDQLSISIYIIYLTISCKNFYTYIYLYIYIHIHTHIYSKNIYSYINSIQFSCCVSMAWHLKPRGQHGHSASTSCKVAGKSLTAQAMAEEHVEVSRQSIGG